MPESYDVIIIGGAVHGASAAYHIAAHPGFSGTILLIEKDQSFAYAATALSAGSIRQQFSSPINIAISLHGIDFLRNIGELLSVGDERPSIGLDEGGYLYLASPAGVAQLTENHALQTGMGADIALFDPVGIVRQFPYVSTDGIAAGAWGRTGEGWFDGYGLMQAFRNKAKSLGVEMASGTVARIAAADGRAERVELVDGRTISGGTIIVAAGTGAAALLAPLGLPLPVEARKRMVFTFSCREKLPGFPLLIDPSGLYCRPEGDLFLCGAAPPEEEDPEAADFDVDHGFFEERLWPLLAQRVPAFETIRPARAWAGHYDMNLFDHNAIIGPLPGIDNLLIANGFSGHGLQQSPAVGRGLAELTVDGRYQTLDLSPLRYERIAAGRKLIEKNVV